MTTEQVIQIETRLARELGAARRAQAAAERAVSAHTAALVELQQQAEQAEQALVAAEGAVLEAEQARAKFRHEQTLEARAERSRQQVADAIRAAADRAHIAAEAARVAAEEEIRHNTALAALVAGQEGN